MSRIVTEAVKKEKRSLLILFAVALIIRLFFVITFDYVIPENDAGGYDQVAQNILNGKGIFFKGQYSLFSPLYPVFLSIIYAIFGHSYHWVLIIQAIISSLTCLAVYFIAKKLIKDRTWAFIAGLFSCFYLDMILITVPLLAECLFTFLFSLGVLFLLKTEEAPKLSNKIIGGIILGLAVLTRPVVMLLPAFILVWLFLKYRSVKAVVSRSFVYFLFFCLTVAPWTMRNYIIHHAFVPVTIQSGRVFWGSHNPSANGGYFSVWTQKGFSAPQGSTEIERDRQGFKEGLKFLKSRTFLQNAKLVFLKIWWFLFPLSPVVYYKYDLTFVLLLPFFVIGIWHLRKSNSLLLYIMANFLLAVMIFYGHPRLRAPASPFIIVLGIAGLKYCYDRFKDKAFFSFVTSGWILFNLGIFISHAVFNFKFLH